jgi:hypothetical protein
VYLKQNIGGGRRHAAILAYQPNDARVVRLPHCIITRTIAVTHDDSDFWNHAVRNSIHHLCPILDDTALFRFTLNQTR